MKKSKQLSKVEFEELLNWLSPVEQEACEEYEYIRTGLARYFRYRGCSDPDNLADLTINRVASKLSKLDLSLTDKKISIFYGFAKNIYREYLYESAKIEISENENQLTLKDLASDDKNAEFECLDKCLSKLDNDEKQMIIDYYGNDREEKIELRKKLAEDMGITLNYLHVRVYRIKKSLTKCFEKCLKKKL